MLLKITSNLFAFEKKQPLWLELICYPEKIKTLPETAFEHEMIVLPDILIEKNIDNLKSLLFQIIQLHFDKKIATELTHAFNRVKKAHGDTGAKRDSGNDYIHHVLMTTLLSWTYAHAFLPPESFDNRRLILSCLYHDAVEDTRIFGTGDAGKQLSKIMKLHGFDIGADVAFLTKMVIRIDKEFENQWKEVGLSAHFSTFQAHLCPAEIRFYKSCDRLANSSDYKYSPVDFVKRKYAETHEYFEAILFDAPEKFRNLFWAYIEIQNHNYGGIF